MRYGGSENVMELGVKMAVPAALMRGGSDVRFIEGRDAVYENVTAISFKRHVVYVQNCYGSSLLV